MKRRGGKIGIILAAALIILAVSAAFVIYRKRDVVHKPDGQAASEGTERAVSEKAEEGTGISGQAKMSEEQTVKAQRAEGRIDPTGVTLRERITVPAGYERTQEREGSLGEFLRDYKMKRDGSPVLLYNGEDAGWDSHAAVFKLPLEKEDLQQCADSVMRMYAEYYWHTGQKEKIAFHLSDGFLAEYGKWRQGYRIRVGERTSSWVKSESADDSYECFQKYMRIVFAYAGTLSMEQESKKIGIKKMRIGDVFLQGGSPGHVVMVVDFCENEKGERAFLLAQGFMPAQEFHVLRNPAHEENPWYYEDEVAYPFVTPGYTFPKGSLRRLAYEKTQ